MDDNNDILKPAYYFDPAGVEYREIFAEAGVVWHLVRNLQEPTLVDRAVRARCATVKPEGRADVTVVGVAELVFATDVSAGPGVTVYGQGGLLCVDKTARLLAGTVITLGDHAVYIGPGAVVGPHAHLDATRGSIAVGPNARLRQGAYLRENSLISSGATIGNSCEIKTSLIGPNAEIPHFNYVGDSVLGVKAHTGAGAKISNVKLTGAAPQGIRIRHHNLSHATGLRKFGVILGDHAQIGCNAVTNPGTLIGPRAVVYAGCVVSGIIPADRIIKLRQSLETAGRRP